MLEIIRYVSDHLFPPRESERIIRDLTDTDIDRLYQPGQYSEHKFIGLFTNPALHALITENKFYHSEKAAAILAKLLDRWVHDASIPLVLIPIPLGPTRKRERGYNQVVEVLKKMKTGSNIPVESKLLLRTTDTTPQTSLDRASRIRNMKHAFLINPTYKKTLPPHTTLVIVDDVVTTGSTLHEAKRALEDHFSSEEVTITTLALSH
jgi:ComF family protein